MPDSYLTGSPAVRPAPCPPAHRLAEPRSASTSLASVGGLPAALPVLCREIWGAGATQRKAGRDPGGRNPPGAMFCLRTTAVARRGSCVRALPFGRHPRPGNIRDLCVGIPRALCSGYSFEPAGRRIGPGHLPNCIIVDLLPKRAGKAPKLNVPTPSRGSTRRRSELLLAIVSPNFVQILANGVCAPAKHPNIRRTPQHLS